MPVKFQHVQRYSLTNRKRVIHR